MKVNGNGEIMLAGILWGTIGIFIWFMKRDGATAEWISFLRVFFSWLILLVFVGWRSGWTSMKVSPKIMVYCALLGLSVMAFIISFTAWPSPLSAYPSGRPAQRGDGVYGCLFGPLLSREDYAHEGHGPGHQYPGLHPGRDRRHAGAFGTIHMGAFLWHHGRPLLCPDRHYRETGRVRNGCLRHEPVELLLGCPLSPGLDPVAARSHDRVAGRFGPGLLLRPHTDRSGYILYYLGLQQIEDLSKVPVLASLETAAAVVLGMALTGDVLHLPNFVGIALIIGSQWLIGKCRHQP